VREYERQQLLERVEREGATVGVRIPERIAIEDGETLALREFVHGVQRLGDTEADPGEVVAVKKRLRRERLHRRNRLEETDDRGEGERLVEEIVGIDRALNTLENLDSDPATEASAREITDRKRWLSFLKRALGHDEGDGPRSTGRGGLEGGP
jgi:hypothetical protein